MTRRQILGIGLLMTAVALIGFSVLYGKLVNINNAAAPNEADVVYGGYNMTQSAANRTDYIGDASKTGRLAGQLPAPDSYYRQQYISLQTAERPYGLTVYYEPAEPDSLASRPVHGERSALAEQARNNALVLFAMIGNAEKVTFAFRDSPSSNGLEQDRYDRFITFERSEFEGEYDIQALGNEPEKLGLLLQDGLLR